ncbi:MAG: hydroxyacid dehydrogenase [Acidobacteria bacterium 37-71-11]|nr:MAG: hydroxyacid dehydrogenase [Acidobacteria bacterium 37-71-11]HQT95190.1 hydroxyacid dehydrogenase [Thermoanaerobaculaceae bacterium]
MLILICDAFDKSLPERLARFGDVTEDIARLPHAEVALVRSKTKCTADWIAGAPKLKLIIRGGVGLDNVDLKAAKERGVEVRNTPAASAVAVAELTFCLMLAVPNKLVEAHNALKEGKFLKKEIKRTELFGKTLGLVGLGRIASEVAKRAAAFGMRVLTYDPFVKRSDVAIMVPTLKELLGQADYISMHVPLTDETRGMINSSTIAAMKDGVVIVNTGRGKCIAEEDLAAALRSGKVGAYATDVWYSDPPDPASPILSAPNVLMTPHIGANSKENLLRIGNEVVALLENWGK